MLLFSLARTLCHVRHPRVQPRVDQVDDEHGKANRHGQDEGDALDDRVVAVDDRHVELVAKPRVGEDNLHQDRAGHHVPQGDGQVRHLGRDGVAHGIPPQDAPFRQTLGIRQQHVVFANRVHHQPPHGQRPRPEAGKNDGQRRQHRVAGDAADVWPGKLPRNPAIVGAAHGEEPGAKGEEIEQQHAHEIIGQHAPDHGQGQHRFHDFGRALPRQQGADGNTQRKGNEHADADQADQTTRWQAG